MKSNIPEISKSIHAQLDENNLAIQNFSAAFDRMEAKLNLCKTHLTNFLDTFEAAFDRDKEEPSYEEMQDYIDAAEFMKSQGRTNYRIGEVQNEMDNRLI